MKNSCFTWNYYQYIVVNLTNETMYGEYEDIEIAKKVCKDKNNEQQYKYAVQQIHSVARFI